MSDSVTAQSSLWGFSAGASQFATQRPDVETDQQEQPTQEPNASPPSSPDDLPPSPIRSNGNAADSTTLDTSIGRSVKMDLSMTNMLTDEQKKETVQLALMLCNANISLDKIEDPFFRAYIQQLKPDAYLPEKQSILSNELKKFCFIIQKKVKDVVKSSEKFAILLDILNGKNGLVLASISFVHWPDEVTQVLFLGVKEIRVENAAESSNPVNEAMRKILRFYGLKVEQALCIITNGFDEAFGVPFKAASDTPTIRSFQRQLKDIFYKIVESDPIHEKLAESVKKMAANLSNYYYPSVQFSNASKLDKKMKPAEMFGCFVRYKQQFLEVCAQFQQIDLNLLSDEEWAELEELHKFYEIFNVYSNVAIEGTYVTVDQTIPMILQLIESLEKGFSVLHEIASKLKSQIEEKFAPILDPEHSAFNPFFVQATALNPNLVVLLNEAQQKVSKKRIYSKLLDCYREVEPPSKKRRLGSRKTEENSDAPTSSLHKTILNAANLKRRRSLDDCRPYKEMYAEKLVNDYFEDAQNNTSFSSFFNFDENLTDNPIDFWKRVSAKCPELSQLAIETIRLPPSTIAPEIANSIKSTSDNPVNPFGFLLNLTEADPEQLERHAVIHYNQCFWSEQSEE